MIVKFTAAGSREFGYWEATDARVVNKIVALVASIKESPFSGLGKPEPLKGNFSGWWSRRITSEHRLVYRVSSGLIEIAQCRYHYSK